MYGVFTPEAIGGRSTFYEHQWACRAKVAPRCLCEKASRLGVQKRERPVLARNAVVRYSGRFRTGDVSGRKRAGTLTLAEVGLRQHQASRAEKVEQKWTRQQIAVAEISIEHESKIAVEVRESAATIGLVGPAGFEPATKRL